MITNVWGSGICIILAIAVFIFLCFKNMHTGIAALIAAFIAAFGSADSLAASMLTTFPSGVGTLVTQMFFVFTASGLLAYLMDKTGAAMSVGKTMVKWLGVERSWMAITITTVILLLAGVGTYTMVVVVLAIPLMKASNLPRKVGLIASYGIAPAISFCMPVANVPGSLPGTFLPDVNTFSAPLLSVACGIVGIVLFVLYMLWMVKDARAKGEGFDGDHNVGEVDTDTSDLPPFATSIIPLIVVVLAAIIMAMIKGGPAGPEGWDFSTITGIDSTNQVAVAQFAGCIAVVLLHFNRCKKEGFVTILSRGCSDMWGFLMLAGCVFGFGQVVSTCAAFGSLQEWVFSLQMNPYISAMISVAIVAFICTDGIAAMMIWGGAGFGAAYMDMGVNAGALRRLLLCTTQTFDSMPHAQATAITLGVYGLTHKQAYKDMFVTSVIIPVIFSVFCCICCMIFYAV